MTNNAPFRRVVFLALLILSIPSESAFAGKESASLDADIQDIDNKMEHLRSEVSELTDNVTKEAFERDKLMLQRRFVTGRDFHFLVHDYVGAAEIFQAIVTHPTAKDLAIYRDAHYFLAESLFHAGYYDESQRRFLEIRSRGAGDSYYALALARLIQVSIIQNNLRQAEGYYTELLSNLPVGMDGSLGRYIYARALFLRGNTAGAVDILNEISEGTDYYPMAQYLLSVIEVKSRNFDGAINRLRRLKATFEPITPEQERVRTQTNLALGRLNYEVNDFPQAVSAYSSVQTDAPQFDQAVYESLWVLLTRNDFLLLKIRDQKLDYDSLSRDFGSYSDVVDIAAENNNMTPVEGEMDKLQDDISDMRTMFEKVDQRLAGLQEEAVNRYNDIVQNAPNSPLLPDAELLVGNIYSQAANFDAAKDIFRQVQSKYGAIYGQVDAARSKLQDPVVLAQLVEHGSADPGDGPKGVVPAGVPEEIAYWLAADKKVRASFEQYEQALRERQDLSEIQDLIGQIQVELGKLESDPTFPIFKDSYRRSLLAQSLAGELQGRIAAATATPGISSSDSARLVSYVPECTQAVARMGALQQTLEQQKRQTIAEYRRTFESLIEPIDSYLPQADTIYSEAAGVVGSEAGRELSDIENRLAEYTRKAEVGIMDADYGATQASSDQIKALQKKMEDELREFRRQYRKSHPGSEAEPTPPPSSSDEGDGK